MFSQAVEAVLIQAAKLKPWRLLIESAYESLKPSEEKRAAIRMLHYYVSIKEWKEARNFIPKRTNEPTHLLFSMWTWLELKELGKAYYLHKKCLRLLRATSPDDELVVSSLLEALGSYFAQSGEWRFAEEAWESGQAYSTFAENAWDGLVKIHAYRALLQANVAFDSAKQNWSSQDDGLMLPGNSDVRCASVDKTFHRYAKHLARVIPAKERWRFGR